MTMQGTKNIGKILVDVIYKISNVIYQKQL